MFELVMERPFHVTVGYLGQPGQRRFLVQGEDDQERATYAIEKSQAEGIAELLAELLGQVGDGPATDWDRAAMVVREPAEPRWRADTVAVGLDDDEERYVIELTELVRPDDVPRRARFHLDRDQARRVAAHAAAVVAEGRPRCDLCHRPVGPDGEHVCPGTNGHGKLTV